MTTTKTPTSPYRIRFPTTEDRDKFLCDSVAHAWLDSSPITAAYHATFGPIDDEHLKAVNEWLAANCPEANIGLAIDGEATSIFGMNIAELDEAITLVERFFRSAARMKDGDALRRNIEVRVLDFAFRDRIPTDGEMVDAGERAEQLYRLFVESRNKAADAFYAELEAATTRVDTAATW